MEKNRESQSYTPEFRQNAVKLALTNGLSRAATARELGVNVNTLHTWVSKFQDTNITQNASSDSQSLADENKSLRKENARLKEEREILKKASAYFASQLS